MKIIFNCHTEYDLKNQFGSAKKTTFNHLPILLNWFASFNIPITFSVAVGGPFKDHLLNDIRQRKIKFPLSSEIAIHFHSERFQNNRWEFHGFLKESAYLKYFKKFETVFGLRPSSLVFGKWKIDKASMDFLGRLGIKRDSSFISPQKIIAKPFLINNVLEIPVVSFKDQSINPLTRLSHFFLLRKIVKKYHQENLICQIGFHSYDLFRFNQISRLRLIKKIIFKNLLKLIKKYNLEITTLSRIEKDNFSELEKIKMPFWGKLFHFLGH